ncbi:hypothetical protein QTP88_004097 [Uroleucon formosanum]
MDHLRLFRLKIVIIIVLRRGQAVTRVAARGKTVVLSVGSQTRNVRLVNLNSRFSFAVMLVEYKRSRTRGERISRDHWSASEQRGQVSIGLGRSWKRDCIPGTLKH